MDCSNCKYCNLDEAKYSKFFSGYVCFKCTNPENEKGETPYTYVLDEYKDKFLCTKYEEK